MTAIVGRDTETAHAGAREDHPPDECRVAASQFLSDHAPEGITEDVDARADPELANGVGETIRYRRQPEREQRELATVRRLGRQP